MARLNGSGSTREIRRGQVWTVEPAGFPKPRPALVISVNPINELCPDVLLIPITTRPGPLRIELAAPADTTGLEKRSYAKCESLGPVHKGRLKEHIGKIPRDVLADVEVGVRRVLGLDPTR